MHFSNDSIEVSVFSDQERRAAMSSCMTAVTVIVAGKFPGQKVEIHVVNNVYCCEK